MIKNLFFYQNLQKIFISSFIVFILLQFVFWLKTENIKPNVHIVPSLPNKYSVETLSLGDKEFYFRVLGLKIQNAGDSFGRFTPLKYYDYEKLYKWFKILDGLNDKSNFIPSLASYYYSQTQNKKDTIHIIKYLNEFASRDIDKHWWWMYQAIFIAKMTLKDQNLALELAYKLSENNNKNAPLWTKQMPAFLHAKYGDGCSAFLIINQILKEHELGIRKVSEEEMNFMKHFIENRLQDLEQKNFNPLKCNKQN